MRKTVLTLALAASAMFVSPATATVLLPDNAGVAFTPIDASTRGTLLESLETGTTGATTYGGFLRSAVYQNSFGTLDFYFQVAITSINVGDEVFNLTASNFLGFTVDALLDTTDFDGGGIFTAANNPNLAGPAGSTTTASRNGSDRWFALISDSTS